MRQQQRADPYHRSGAFSDGLAMRVPPPGTAEYSSERAGTAAIATGRQGGVALHDIPVPITPELLERGQREFEIFCAACHGENGAGQAVMAANIPGNAPPSLLAPHAAQLSAGELFALISQGRNRMPAYSWALPAGDRWAVVAHMRTLQRPRMPGSR